MKLYKYMRAIEYDKDENYIISPKLLNALIGSKIFFSHPANFNDPLECIVPIKIDDYEKNGSAYLEFVKEYLKKYLKEDDSSNRMKRINEAINFGLPLENCLISCLSTKENNALMWSHYADQYKGICLCYELPDSIKELENKVSWSRDVQDLEESGLELWTCDVKYSKKRPQLEIENTNLPVEQWKFKNNYKMDNALFIKPEYWSYEQEWRIALILPLNCGRAFSPEIETKNYYMIIPREWLKQITFGFRLDDQHCQKITEILKENGYENVSINTIQLSHDTFELSTVLYKS